MQQLLIPLRKPPSLRNNNGAVQLRVRINSNDAFINRLGKWSDPTAVAKASALSARIWADFCSGSFDATLRTYQASGDRQDTELLSALQRLAESTRQGRTIHAYRTLKKYGKTIRTKDDTRDFVIWMQNQGLQNRTIAGILCECRRVLPESKSLFSYQLKIPKASIQSDVLGTEDIKKVLEYIREKESWFYPLFFLWLSTGLRNGELRALTWDSINWNDGELLISKSLRIDGLNTHRFIPSTTKTGVERIVPINPSVLKVLKEHQEHQRSLNLYDPDGLVFLTPISHQNVYDSLLGKVWKRSLTRCGLKPRRLYSQRHSFISHSLAMGNSAADLAQVAGHSTETMLKIYAKPTGRLLLPSW